MPRALRRSRHNASRSRIRRVEHMGKKYLALTFDDGPNTTVTEAVLDILERNGIPATFFLIGNNITDSSAETVKRAVSLGCEIENHSFTHRAFPSLSEQETAEEISRTSKLIKDIAGDAPRFFRPPYIALSGDMFERIPLVFIEGIGCDDWLDSVSAQERFERITGKAKNGDIILLHDMQGNQKTVEACNMIIPCLKDRGYEFVTVADLFSNLGVTPEKGVIYTNVLNAAPWVG